LWCRDSKAFCERPFALEREQPENDKQSVDVAPDLEKVLRKPMGVGRIFFMGGCTRGFFQNFCRVGLALFYKTMFSHVPFYDFIFLLKEWMPSFACFLSNVCFVRVPSIVFLPCDASGVLTLVVLYYI